MKKLLLPLIAIAMFSCSSSDDSMIVDSGLSTFTVQVFRNGDVDNWYDELELRTSVDGWDLTNSDDISDGFLTGNDISDAFSITSRSKLDELTISYLTTPYFDGTTFLDDSVPTTLSVTFSIFENGEFLDKKELVLQGNETNKATQDYEYNFIVD